MTTALACRSCGSGGLALVLSLGRTPLANALRSDEDLARPEETFPLDLHFCPACGLAQIGETVSPEKLFRDYAYFSSFSDEMVRHAGAIAQRMIGEQGLGSASLVMEVASNDGYLLQHYVRRGIPVLGIEPAENVAKVAVEQRGVPTRCEFFGDATARQLAAEGRRADVVHANNVMAHVPDVNGFAAGVAAVLAPRGLAVIEVPYVRDLVDRCEFDTIYHEHVFYFSLTALVGVFERHGLEVRDVEHLPIHGGTLRVFVGRPGRAGGGPRPAVAAMLRGERAAGVDRVDFYHAFGARVRALREDLRHLLSGLKRDGRRLAAYGAAAKGSTLLNYAGIGPETLDFVADRSPYKQGRYMPGVRLPIVAPSALVERMPDYVLLLVWNFADEVLAQQAEYRVRGGRFIVPVPAVRII